MLSRLDLPHKLWYVVWRALIGHLVLSNRSERSKQTWCTFTWEIFFVGSSHDFLQKWAITGLFFVYFRVFKQTIFTTNKCEKCPSSIQCWDSNPRPSEHESPPNNHKAMAPTLKMIKPRFGQTGLTEPCDCSKKVSTSRHLIDKEALPRRWSWRRRCRRRTLRRVLGAAEADLPEAGHRHVDVHDAAVSAIYWFYKICLKRPSSSSLSFTLWQCRNCIPIGILVWVYIEYFSEIYLVSSRIETFCSEMKWRMLRNV